MQDGVGPYVGYPELAACQAKGVLEFATDVDAPVVLRVEQLAEVLRPHHPPGTRQRAEHVAGIYLDPDRIARWARARYSAGRPGHPPRRRIHRRHGRHRVPGGLARAAGGVRIRGAGNGPDQVPSPLGNDLQRSIWCAAPADAISGRSLHRVPVTADPTATALRP